MTNLDSILKSKDMTLSTKVHLVKAMVFPVVMYGSESWTIKKAQRRRIEAVELWSWGKLFRVPWTARRSNQSILEEIRPGCSLEGLMLKLKLNTLGIAPGSSIGSHVQKGSVDINYVVSGTGHPVPPSKERIALPRWQGHGR